MADLFNIAGRINSTSQEGVAAVARQILDETQNKKQSEVNTDLDDKIEAETERAETAEANRYTKDETYSRTELNNLITTPNVNYVVVSVFADLPATGAADTIYRVSSYDGNQSQVNVTMYSEYAWNGTAYVLLCVKSQIDEVFDISAYHNSATYADLAAALGTGGENIPESLRRGGMRIQFIKGTVQSSDNKYVQFRLMNDSWSVDTDEWALCSEDVLVENPEFIEVKTDSEGKILWAIKNDGSIYWGAGVPQQVIDYVESKITELGIDDIITFLGNLPEGDNLTTLLAAKANVTDVNTALNGKVDKVEGESLVDSEYASSMSAIENPEYVQITTDSEDKILEGITSEGIKEINIPIDTPSASVEHIDNPEYISVVTDKENKILESIKKDGSKVFEKPVVFNDDVTFNGNLNSPTLEQLKEKEKQVRSYLIEHQMYNAPTISSAMFAVAEGSDVDEKGNVYIGSCNMDNSSGEHQAEGNTYAAIINFNLVNPYSSQMYKTIEVGDTIAVRVGSEDVQEEIFQVGQYITKIIDDNTVRGIANLNTYRQSDSSTIERACVTYLDFNRTTKTTIGSLGLCTITIDGTTYRLHSDDYQAFIAKIRQLYPEFEEFPWTPGGTDYRGFHMCTNDPCKIDDKFYCTFYMGSGGAVVLRSSDMIDWEVFTCIPIGYYCEEVQLVSRGDYLFAFTRGRINDRGLTDTDMPNNPHHSGVGLRYNLTTNQWDIKGDDAYVLENSWGDRPTAAIKTNKIYVFAGNYSLNANTEWYPTQSQGYGSPRNGRSLYVFDFDLNLLNKFNFTFQRGSLNIQLVNFNGNLFAILPCDLRGLFMHPSPADVVNMEGCTEASFKCLGYNLTGVEPAVLDENGHILSVNSQWQRIDYNSSYELYQSTEYYSRSLPADGRNGITFSYLDNRLFDI